MRLCQFYPQISCFFPHLHKEIVWSIIIIGTWAHDECGWNNGWKGCINSLWRHPPTGRTSVLFFFFFFFLMNQRNQVWASSFIIIITVLSLGFKGLFSKKCRQTRKTCGCRFHWFSTRLFFSLYEWINVCGDAEIFQRSHTCCSAVLKRKKTSSWLHTKLWS